MAKIVVLLVDNDVIKNLTGRYFHNLDFYQYYKTTFFFETVNKDKFYYQNKISVNF